MALLAPLLEQNLTYTAAQLRDIFSLFADGVVEDGALKVSQRAAGANMSVDIAAGAALIPAAVAGRGRYLCRSTIVENRPIAAAPAAGTSRIDLVTAKVTDTQYGDAVSAWTLEVVPGTAAGGTPPTPNVPAGSVLLATVTVGAGVASIGNFSIPDRRLFAAAATRSQFAARVTAQPASTPLTAVQTDTYMLTQFDAPLFGAPPPARPLIVTAMFTGSLILAAGGTLATGVVKVQVSFDAGGNWVDGLPIPGVPVGSPGTPLTAQAVARGAPVNGNGNDLRARIVAYRTGDPTNITGQLAVTTTPG